MLGDEVMIENLDRNLDWKNLLILVLKEFKVWCKIILIKVNVDKEIDS